MLDDEYVSRLRECFAEEFFSGTYDFLFSKSALVEGLSHIEKDSMWIEEALEDDKRLDRGDLIYICRTMQAVANILKVSLNGLRLLPN